MTNDRYSEIDGVISYIHESISEPLLLSRLADFAGYSPYHFTRIFKERVGLPPLYYVSSLRLQKAKDLLLRTNLSIRDISLEIGQQSLGTFTSRFTERVGMTPSQFRHSAQQTDTYLTTLKKLDDWRSLQPALHSHARIEGTIEAEVPFEGFILLGLFAKPIPEGLPLYGTLLSSLGTFCLTGVKPGTYYLMATSVAWGMQAMDVLLPQTTLRTRSREPIRVKPYSPVPHQQVTLHLPRLDDPPILISLPVLMNNFLNRVPVH
ncbi:helix-turn-helix transcriptional regulator [Paenibacillus puerhi]|uniref:helix-turn-helix transcriptional regulator n=1 Tax=Paenibacillus puerhi TaxID=2692622 RepID=UPI0013595295|nr:AraC family transcriptional regulator [Paenibacillus puerhi]